ncbi:putative uncharacterized zinc finger protein 814 [Trichogramma pretiosum]|uniref:putative uncharacterized zinc finger protein 814 n=1 Tax=Trichogramma pretiosum TaxID=7493 RepID=UPI000C71A756|nr:putative uncharacterized zinc finger protein 814 [Trichogramma pretiosum]
MLIGVDNMKSDDPLNNPLDNIGQFVVCLACNSDSPYVRRETRKNCHVCRNPFKYRCGKCNRHYLSYTALSFHQRHLCDQEPKFFCSDCNYKTNHKGNLMNHIHNIHEQTNWEKCEHCGKMFKTRNYLRSHQKYSNCLLKNASL